MIIASLNRDGDIYEIEADERIFESQHVTEGRLVASMVESVDFQFDADGYLRSAVVKFSVQG